MTREEAIQVLKMVEAYGLADEAKRMAIEALSADTVEVVRCKDCKYWNDWGLGAGTCERSKNGYFWYGTDFNDYCSFGERSEE